MAKRHYLRFLIRNQPDLIFEVREEDKNRLDTFLFEMNRPHNGCFWFSTIDGRSVSINLDYIQAVRFLWDASELLPDIARSSDSINLCLRDRNEIIEAYTEDTEELYEFFMNLELGSEQVPFPFFIDEDGEVIQVNSKEVVWATAPTHLMEEGEQIVAVRDGLIE